MRHRHRALLHQHGGQVAPSAFAGPAAAAALHAAVDGHGQRRARRHQCLAGQRHQGAGSDGGQRACRPVEPVVILLFSAFFRGTYKRTKHVVNGIRSILLYRLTNPKAGQLVRYWLLSLDTYVHICTNPPCLALTSYKIEGLDLNLI